MFVVDLLHEVELGAAKGVITQLIRIMYSPSQYLTKGDYPLI